MTTPSPEFTRHESTASGSRPTIVLTGSLGTDGSMWQAQIGPLRQIAHVVTVNTRGHGTAPTGDEPFGVDDLADDLLAVLDRLSVSRAHIVGLSLGAMVALRLAARDPDRVERLVVMCTSAKPGTAAMWQARAELVRQQGTQAIVQQTAARWFTPALESRDRGAVRSLLNVLARQDAHGYAACCEVLAGIDLGDDLPRVAAPTLVVAGAEDPTSSIDQLRHIADTVMAGRLAVVESASHLAPVEQPEVVTSLLLDHLAAGE